MKLEGLLYIFVMDLIWCLIVYVSNYLMDSFMDVEFNITFEERINALFNNTFIPFFIGGVLIYGSNIWNL